MIIYLICYVICFTAARLGWFLPSGLVLIAGGFYLYWKDYRATGNLIHLRGLFCLFFVGGQGLSCMKLSQLQKPWSLMAWICFFLSVAFFYLAYGAAERLIGPVREPHWIKKQAGGRVGGLPWKSRVGLKKYERALFRSIVTITALSTAAFLAEAVILGYVPLFLRGVPHAYSYFHISGLHYFTVACVLVPSLFVVYAMAKDERRPERSMLVFFLTIISLLIPILCVSRFQLILAVGMAVMVFIAANKQIRLWHMAVLVCLLVPAYLFLSVARSHDVEYLNRIFEMKNSAMPIFITQPYMYIANNYDNFNCLTEQLPAYSHGLRMLFPIWALTGLKFLKPELVAFPLYVNKEELTTLTLIYDAYYDFGVWGVILFSMVLGIIAYLLVRGLNRQTNPVGYLFYAQFAMYMMLSFFTTWFSNAATWFYFAVTGMVYFYVEYR